MDCQQARERMMCELDSGLQDEELHQHLSACSDCRRAWRRLQAVDHLLHQAPTLSAPAGFIGRTMARIDRRRRVRRTLLSATVLAAAAAATAGLAIAPSIWALPPLFDGIEPFLWAGIPLVARLLRAWCLLLRSLWVTADALASFLVAIAAAGLVAALAANALWLRFIRRLQPTTSHFVRR